MPERQWTSLGLQERCHWICPGLCMRLRGCLQTGLKKKLLLEIPLQYSPHQLVNVTEVDQTLKTKHILLLYITSLWTISDLDTQEEPMKQSFLPLHLENLVRIHEWSLDHTKLICTTHWSMVDFHIRCISCICMYVVAHVWGLLRRFIMGLFHFQLAIYQWLCLLMLWWMLTQSSPKSPQISVGIPPR